MLFGFGQVPAMLATIGFAMPPMARCTILGIRTVPSDILEAGQMAGLHAAPDCFGKSSYRPPSRPCCSASTRW